MSNKSLEAIFSAYHSLNPNYRARNGKTLFDDFKGRISDHAATEAAHDLLIEAGWVVPVVPTGFVCASTDFGSLAGRPVT